MLNVLPSSLLATVVLLVVASLGHVPAQAQCPAEPTLQHYTGAGAVVCPCFVTGEQAGAVFVAPAAHYPIEILRVAFGWGSQVSGAPESLEEAIHIYPAGLPNPGTAIFSLVGPLLTDGAINEFDLEPQPGSIVVNSGPFSVALEFANSNAGDPFAPSVVHDGNGCHIGKNTVYAIPGGWNDACQLGVSGDWVIHVVYRRVNCSVGVEYPLDPIGARPMLFAPRPNPTATGADLEFLLPEVGDVSLVIYDATGRLVRRLLDGWMPPGRHQARWDQTDANGARVAAGLYLVELRAGGVRSTRKLTTVEPGGSR